MTLRSYCSAALGALCLTGVPFPAAFGHGEVDEAHLAEFHLHLDDYRAEIEELVNDVEAIVSGYEDGSTDVADVDELFEHWEEVAVHAAIENRATVIYPGVWQALVQLRQAVDGGRDAEAVSDAGAGVEAALWQGFGAVRLAANRVSETEAVSAQTEAPATGPETIAEILDDLDRAVAAYGDDELQKAEELIHTTYMSRFEGLEGDLIERDPDLVQSLEQDFNATLPLLMQQGASMERVNETLDSMRAQLEAAEAILREVEQSRSEVF